MNITSCPQSVYHPASAKSTVSFTASKVPLSNTAGEIPELKLNLFGKLLSAIYQSAPVQKIINWAVTESPKKFQYENLMKDEKPKTNAGRLSAHIGAIYGLWIAGFYILNTNNSKKIPEERKTPMNINTIFTTATGLILAYVLNGAGEKFIRALTPRIDKVLEKNPDKKLIKDGINKLVPLAAFVVSLRFLCPVIATPASELINKTLIKLHLIKDNNAPKKDSDKKAK